jgi:pantothenate kinase-related protein Tda10
MYSNYVEAIDRFGTKLNNYTSTIKQPSIDVVLVDGRARVACAIKALWSIDDASVVLLHDYASRVYAYATVMKYYDVIHQVDSMVVLARKPVLDWDGAKRDLAKFMTVVD